MTEIELKKESGRRIALARKAAKLTQQDVVDLCGWDGKNRLSNYEQGTRWIGVLEANLLAKHLDVTASYLLTTESEQEMLLRKQAAITDEEAALLMNLRSREISPAKVMTVLDALLPDKQHETQSKARFSRKSAESSMPLDILRKNKGLG